MVRKKDIKRMDAIVKKVGLSREQRRILHDDIQGLGLTPQEILEAARAIKREFPGKRDERE